MSAFSPGFSSGFGPPERRAELQLHIGNSGTWEDGDVMRAFNSVYISTAHLKVICHPQKAIRNGSGLIQTGTRFQEFYERLFQFKFERISTSEVRRTNLETLEEEVISDVPNAKGEYADVELWVERRYEAIADINRRSRVQLFGTPGAEIWYGGEFSPDHTKLDAVWDKVQAETGQTRPDTMRHPAGNFRKYLIIGVDDFTSTERGALEMSVREQVGTDTDGTPMFGTTQSRKNRVEIDAKVLPILRRSRAQVDDRSVSIDGRSVRFLRESVVVGKT